MTCPQCSETIEGTHTQTYAVGWCQFDVHTDCLRLHVRSCKACRIHNEGFVTRQDEKQLAETAKRAQRANVAGSY